MSSKRSEALSVAIDGPAGAGKSTTARMLAARLSYIYVDSGAMYRAVALYCQENATDNADTERVIQAAADLDIRFEPATDGGQDQKVLVGGKDVTKAIRTPEIAQLASSISAIPKVRESLVAKQRALGRAGGVVMEGRDIGTVVLPDADVKIFLTASIDERARRRFIEFEQKGATDITFEQVRSDMAERDQRDSTRAVSPLMPAEDSVVLESDDMTAHEVVDSILDICTSRLEGGTA